MLVPIKKWYFVDIRSSLQEFLTIRQKFTGKNTTIFLRKETKFMYITDKPMILSYCINYRKDVRPLY